MLTTAIKQTSQIGLERVTQTFGVPVHIEVTFMLCMHARLHAESLQSYPTLCDPMDSSPPGSSVHMILQARILQWVAISFSLDVSRIFYHSELQTLPSSLFRFTQILILCKHQFFSQCFISGLSLTSPLANCFVLTSRFFTGCLQF